MLLLVGTPVFAQDKPPEPPTAVSVNTALEEKGYDLDTVWTLVAGFLVMWMQAGFAAVEIGFTRAKNAVNILMKNLLDYAFGSLAFLAIGFGIMFSIGNPYFGTSGFFLAESKVKVTSTGEDGKPKEEEKSNFDPISWTKVPLKCKFFFQLVFAATAATIVSGAMAERTKFISYILYSIVISAFIYPVSGHWIWGAGWLAQLREVTIDGTKTMTGVFDFAGSTVVHSVGGWLALVGALILGPRLGKFSADGKINAIPGHNIPLAALGVFILWLGWFGFNPGSTMSAVRNDISHIVCTTNTAGAAGVLSALLVARILFKKWDSGMALNGALAGLVGITAGCAWVTIPSSAIIGLVAGVLVVFSILFIERVLKIDDPVGAISVHGVCGAFGTLCVGLFADPKTVGIAGPLPGLFAGGGATQLVNQAIGVGVVFLWCVATGLVLFVAIKYTVGLRVSKEEEIEGLDIGEHGNVAYHGFVFSPGMDHLASATSEPRAASIPADGSTRFSIRVEGPSEAALTTTWSDLCQPTAAASSADFKMVYEHMTTVSGSRFRFRGGDPQKIRTSLERLLAGKMGTPGLRVLVEQ